MSRNYVANGAFFKDPQINDGKVHPVGHIALEICGVKLNLAVWPKMTSPKGTAYFPVSGDYHQKESRRLIDVTPMIGQGQAGEANSAENVEQPPAPKDDLPF